GHAVEDPAQFRMLDHLGLVEDDGFAWVQSRRDIGGGDLIGPALEVLRVLPNRDRVHVDHAIDSFVRILQRNEAADRAKIIAQVQIARGLDAGKNAGRESHEESLKKHKRWGNIYIPSAPMSSSPAPAPQPAHESAQWLRAAEMDQGEKKRRRKQA